MFLEQTESIVIVMYSSTYVDHSNSVCVSQQSPGEITAFLLEMEIEPFKNAQQMWRLTPVRSAHLMEEQWLGFGNVRLMWRSQNREY